VGGGTVFPEFRLSAEKPSSGGLEPLLTLAEEALAAAAGQVEGAVLDVDLSGSPLQEGCGETLSRLAEFRNSFQRRRQLTAAIRVTLPSGGLHVRAALDAGPDIVNMEIAKGLRLFRSALRAADLRGLLAAVALMAAPAAAASAAEMRERIPPDGPVLGAVSARLFVREAMRGLEGRPAPEAVCAIALAACAVPVLAACEAGAAGPAREGAWESLFVRTITGCPVSLSAARPWEPAVLAMADLWQGSSAPLQTVSECLALRRGEAPAAPGTLPPGAVARVLSADAIGSIAEAIQTCRQPYQRAVAAAYAAATIVGESSPDAAVAVGASDREFALRAAEELISLPESGQDLLEEAGSRYGSSILSGESTE
jgi:hypothetical protein